VDARDFFQIVDVGHGGRFDADQLDSALDQPLGEFVADARQPVAVDRRVIDVPAPAGVEQQAVAGFDLAGDRAEIRSAGFRSPKKSRSLGSDFPPTSLPVTARVACAFVSPGRFLWAAEICRNQ